MSTTNLGVLFRQELANSISHGFGVLFGIVCIPILIAAATNSGTTAGVVGASIYGFTFLMIFTASTLYHSFQQPELKRIFKTIDHISIYFMIAGTYTPFILVYMCDATGIAFLSTIWSLTLLGIFFKIYFVSRFKILSTLIYVAMGWSLVVIWNPFFASISAPIIALLAVGGGLYTLGVLFYLWRSFTYHHAVWHFFVLAASICHYVAVLLAVSHP